MAGAPSARGLVLAALLGVATQAPAQDAGPTGDWRITRLGIADIQPADDVTLVLAEGRASGRSGCNRFLGDYTVAGEALTLGPLAMTRMACFGRAAEVEAWFLRAVSRIDGWRRDGEALELLDGALPVLRALPAGTTP